jgi:hypothetical protein
VFVADGVTGVSPVTKHFASSSPSSSSFARSSSACPSAVSLDLVVDLRIDLAKPVQDRLGRGVLHSAIALHGDQRGAAAGAVGDQPGAPLVDSMTCQRGGKASRFVTGSENCS